jgi:hypothetical protein
VCYRVIEASIESVSNISATLLDVVGNQESHTLASQSNLVIYPKQIVDVPVQIIGRAGMTHLKADVCCSKRTHKDVVGYPGYKVWLMLNRLEV